MGEYQPLAYGGAKPGADSNDYVLFDSTTPDDARALSLAQFRRFILVLKNSAAGTLKAFISGDNGKTWLQTHQYAVSAAPAIGANNVGFALQPNAAFRLVWTNGGNAQATWYVAQGLDDGASAIGAALISGDGSSSSSTSITTTQLPVSLGQKPSSGSLPVVEASDSKITKAASLRGYVRGEGLPIAIGTNSEAFTVPAAWLGKHVRLTADGGDAYYQISETATLAVVDRAARAIKTGTNPAALTPSASGNGCGKLARDLPQDIPFSLTATTFALMGTTADMVVRAHLAET